MKRVQKSLLEVQFDLKDPRFSGHVDVDVGPAGIQLSGGQLQRMQLARAHYHHAPFVLIDEGTSALDPVTEGDVFRTLRQIASTGVAVVMIAHRRAAVEMSDEVIVMDHGRIVASGSPSDVLKQPVAAMVFGQGL